MCVNYLQNFLDLNVLTSKSILLHFIARKDMLSKRSLSDLIKNTSSLPSNVFVVGVFWLLFWLKGKEWARLTLHSLIVVKLYLKK